MKETEVDLSQDDINLLKKELKKIQKFSFYSVPILLFLCIFLVKNSDFESFIGAILCFLLLLINLIIYYANNKQIKNDLRSSKKIVIKGELENLLVERNISEYGSAGPSEFKIDFEKQIIYYKTIASKGSEELSESFVLGKGQKELFEYFIVLNNKKIAIFRSDFLSLKKGDYVQVELSQSEKLLAFKKLIP